MALEPDSTKAELQAIAFGRSAHTDAERAEAIARLAALEAPVVIAQPTEPPEPAGRIPSPRRRFALITLAVVVAAAVIAAVGIYREQQDPFAAFKRPPTSAELDYPFPVFGDDFDSQDLRMLADDPSYQVWGYRGPSITGQGDGTEVCLVAVGGPAKSNMNCAPENKVTTEGLSSGQLELSVDSDGTRRFVKYTWGPSEPLSRTFTTIPPPPTVDQTFERKPTDKDLEGREYLLSESVAVSESARWVADYRDARIWIYRDAQDSVCMMAADTASGVGRVAAACVSDAEFRASGASLDWQVDAVRFDLSPALQVSVSTLG